MLSTERFDRFLSELLRAIKEDFGKVGCNDLVWVEYEVKVRDYTTRDGFLIRFYYLNHR